jgi:hypothetical protein
MARDRPPSAPYPGFTELPTFTRRWAALGLGDEDLQDLQQLLGEAPTAWPVVPGAGGFRKARFAPPSWPGGGKSGGVRVYYAHLPGYGMILLGAAYAKGQQGDLSAAEKKGLAALLQVYLQERERLEGESDG